MAVQNVSQSLKNDESQLELFPFATKLIDIISKSLTDSLRFRLDDDEMEGKWEVAAFVSRSHGGE